MRKLSTYEVFRSDGTLVKESGPIDDDPQGLYANAEAIDAAMNDAKTLGVELDEENIVVHYIKTREDAHGRPY